MMGEMTEIIADEMTKEEKTNTDRILAQQEGTAILSGFLDLGFRSYTSFRTICKHYDNSLTEEHLSAYWRLRKIIPGMNNKIRTVLNKLKSE